MRALSMAMALALAGMGTAARAADFDGDGTGEIAIFRPSSGLWSVRGVTRIYSGATGDSPVPGDYSGSGQDQAAVYRPSSGMWAVRGVTRVYCGGGSDVPVPGDFNGDGRYDMGIFRAGTGLWAVHNLTRAYFGGSGDVAVSPGRSTIRGVLKTGQSSSYHTGDDGQYEKGRAFNRQTADPAGNGEIVTIDNVTGLMWASDGNGAGCFSGGTRTWTEALDWAEGLTFAGYSDWRLPNRRELESLVDAGRENPAIDAAYFPNTVSDYYWTGTTYQSTTSMAWIVYCRYGNVDPTSKIGAYYVRAVRRGQ